MRYRVTARSWSSNLQKDFGAVDGTHELTDAEVVGYFLRFGRADLSLDEKTDTRVIDFQNDYDAGIANVRIVL